MKIWDDLKEEFWEVTDKDFILKDFEPTWEWIEKNFVPNDYVIREGTGRTDSSVVEKIPEFAGENSEKWRLEDRRSELAEKFMELLINSPNFRNIGFLQPSSPESMVKFVWELADEFLKQENK